MQFSRWKEMLVYGVCAFGVLFSMPNFVSQQFLERMPGFFPSRKISLGLDLRGGAHLLLDVDADAALKEQMNMALDCVRQEFLKEGIRVSSLPYAVEKGMHGFEFKVKDEKNIARVKHLLENIMSGFSIEFDGDLCKVAMSDSQRLRQMREVVDRSMEVVRKRVDSTGMKEINLQRAGTGRILLQIPGVSDPESVKKLLGKTAKMTFHMVESQENVGDNANVEWMHCSDGEYLPIQKQAMIGGENLLDARVQKDEYNQMQVWFKFNALGTKKFAEITAKNVGKRFAIVLDNVVISAPVIQECISGGSGVITGRFSIAEAKELSLLLRAGALPAPLSVAEEKVIGPDLGQDSINSGILATMISILLVCVFMYMWYSSFGMITNIALIMNLVIILALLSCLQATLTLPGIAGIALTIGTAVDVNILINERIKESLRSGKKILKAIDDGYSMAMSSIIDTNLNTILGMACLYYFGTGSIRGFAITTALGTIVSFFTATTLTRFLIAKLITARVKLNIPV